MTTLPDRFWRKVTKTETCWLWTAGLTANGYGKVMIDRRQVYAHRVAYEALVGAIPDRMVVDHKCHEKRCVNPAHLHAVTVSENAQNRAGAQVNSRSGVRGVHGKPGRWRVQVRAGGRTRSGGMFTDLADAEAAAIALRTHLMSNSISERGAAA